MSKGSGLLKKRDYHWFEMARQQAINSDFGSIRLGCVVVYQGRIIGRGYNTSKTDPIQKEYNQKYRSFKKSSKPAHHSLHAEIAAIKSVPRSVDVSIDWSRVKVYIYRICPGKPLHQGLSKPCPACYNFMKDKGIRHIYFTEDDGFGYKEIM